MSLQPVLVVGVVVLLLVGLYFHPSIMLPLFLQWVTSQTVQSHHRTEIVIVKIVEFDQAGECRQLIVDWRKEIDIR